MAESWEDYWRSYKPDIQRALEDKRRRGKGTVRLKDLTQQGRGGKLGKPRRDLYCHFKVAYGEETKVSGKQHVTSLLVVLVPMLKSGDRLTVEIANQDGEDLLKFS